MSRRYLPTRERKVPVSERPIIVFDVNETLLDLDAIRPFFDRVFNEAAAMPCGSRG